MVIGLPVNISSKVKDYYEMKGKAPSNNWLHCKVCGWQSECFSQYPNETFKSEYSGTHKCHIKSLINHINSHRFELALLEE